MAWKQMSSQRYVYEGEDTYPGSCILVLFQDERWSIWLYNTEKENYYRIPTGRLGHGHNKLDVAQRRAMFFQKVYGPHHEKAGIRQVVNRTLRCRCGNRELYLLSAPKLYECKRCKHAVVDHTEKEE